MKRHESQSNRLADLLGGIDPAWISEALATETPEALAALSKKSVPDRMSKPRSSSAGRNRVLIASAAAVLVLALILPVALRLTGSHGTIPQDTSSSDGYTDPTSVIPPWRNGELKLASLTYRSSSVSASLRPPAFDLLTDRTDTTVGPPDAATEPNTDGALYGEGEEENFAVSIMENVKINSYMGSDLIKLRPESGDHVDCPDVYFDIRANEYTCMSCRILSLMEGNEEYADAAIRCFVEECLVSYSKLMGSGEDHEYRTGYYDLLIAPANKAYFEGRKKLTLKKLGITEFMSDEHREYAERNIPDFEYPVADVAEYGTDMGKCLFTLTSPRTGVAYGNYICDLESGEITRIDRNCEGYDVPNLSAVSGICITNDYKTIIAAVPDFSYMLNAIPHTDLYKPVYSGNNLCIFRVGTGECERLIDRVNQGNAPATAVAERLGVLTYVGTDGLTYAYWNGTFYSMAGELTRVIRDTDGGRYAVMKQGDDYRIYSLKDTHSLLVSSSELEDKLDEGNRYVVEGNLRIDLLRGETLTLWEGEPATSVVSKDGRLIYLYFSGEDRVHCLDVWTEERGYLSLSDSFTEAACEAGEITYTLLLNAEENRLLMTYFKDGQVVFDAEAFRENVGTAGGSIRKALEEVVHYYTINGDPLRFYEKSKAQDMLCLLAVTPYLDALVADNTSRETNLAISIRVAEALIPYLNVWAHSAEVPDGVVESMLGDMTLTMFRDYFYTIKRYAERFKPKELASEYGIDRDSAINGLSEEFAADYLFFLGVNATAENRGILRDKACAVLDLIVDDLRCVSEYDLSLAYRSLLCEITPALTGMTYAEFIQSCRYMDDGESLCFVTTDNTANDIRCGLNLDYDRDFVRGFITGLTFTEGEMEIKAEGRLSRRVFMEYWVSFSQSILEVGYAADGKAYAVIDGYYAEITPDALEEFKTRCVDRDSEIAYYPEIY